MHDLEVKQEVVRGTRRGERAFGEIAGRILQRAVPLVPISVIATKIRCRSSQPSSRSLTYLDDPVECNEPAL